jgi:DNA-binding transcriptional LysR family regulator
MAYMTIDALVYFLAVNEHGSFSEAAVALSISQSSLSKHIKSLEDEFGVTLFRRTTRKLSLTEAGERFVKYADRIVGECDALANTMRNYTSHEENTLKIVSVPALHLYHLTQMIGEFREKNPNVQLTISETPTSTVISEIEKQNAHIAIIRTNIFPTHKNYLLYPIADEELVVLCNALHNFAGAGEVSLDDLYNEKFVLLKSGVYDYETGLRKLGVTFNFEKRGILCQNPDSLKHFIKQNAAISLMMGKMAEYITKDSGSDMIIVPIKERPSFPLALALHPENRTDVCMDFVKHAGVFYMKRFA